MGQPKVAIVITAYLAESKPYLDLCMRSIKNLDYPTSRISVVIVAPKDYAPQYPGAMTISPLEPLKYSNAHAINLGVSKALESWPDYVVYANDDVIFTDKSIASLVYTMRRYDRLLLMPISNDQQGRYYVDLPIIGPYKLEQALEIEDTLLNCPNMNPDILILAETLCTYVMIFTPNFWREVGGMDERFLKGGPDDIDLCLRARQKGYQPAITTNAIVWHAGGVSADLTHDPATREENHRLFNEKWSGK